MRTLLVTLIIIFSLAGQGQAQQRPSYLPNSRLTPGEALKVNKDDLCGSGYKPSDRSVPMSLKRTVFDRYLIKAGDPTPYNVDHLIPVSLGGTNSIKNLWPQPLTGEWSYLKKNKLEQRLYKLVCRGELAPEMAQEEISTDWVSAYKKHLGGPRRGRSNRD
jgi:hypothetical protein